MPDLPAVMLLSWLGLSSVHTCLVRDEGGERLQRSVSVIEASHGLGPLEQQDVGYSHGPKPCGEAGGRVLGVINLSGSGSGVHTHTYQKKTSPVTCCAARHPAPGSACWERPGAGR